MTLKIVTFLIMCGIIVKTFIGFEKKSTAEVVCNVAVVLTIAALIRTFF